MKYSRRNRNNILLGLFLFSVSIYVVFFFNKIRNLSNTREFQVSIYDGLILVGTEGQESEFVTSFFQGVKTVCNAYNSGTKLLAPEAGQKFSSLDQWCQYAEFVGADGLILFSTDENFQVRELKNIHGEEIPVVLAGVCSSKSKIVSHIAVSNYEEGKKLAAEIKNGNFKKPLALLRKNYPSDEIYRIISSVEQNLTDTKVAVQNFESADIIDDEVRSCLLAISLNNSADLIICYTPDDLNLVSRTLIDLNLTNRLSLMGIYGDSKSAEYLKKDIISCVINAVPFEMGAASAVELFTWKEISFANSYKTIDVKVLKGGDL